MNIETFRELEKYFYRAPSAHNTQPWVLQYGEDSVGLFFDPDRRLPVTDPENRDLFLALGAFIETVLIVTSTSQLPVGFKANIDLEYHRVGEFIPSSSGYHTEFTLEEVMKRQTSRLLYTKSNSQQLIDELVSNIPPSVKLYHCYSLDLLELFITSDRYMFGNETIINELYTWLRLDKSDKRYDQDGLNAECMNLSNLEARLLSVLLHPRIYPLTRLTRVTKLLSHFSAEILKDNSDVIILSSQYKSHEDLLELGRALQQIWLYLAKHSHYTHPLSQIIDCPNTYNLLAEKLNLAPGERVFSIFRFGTSKTPAYSPRLIS